MAKRARRATARAPSGRQRGTTIQGELLRQRALDALHKVRAEGKSLAQAARESHIDPRTVQRRVGSALIKLPTGRYAATKSDRLPRQMHVLTPKGVVAGEVRGSRPASFRLTVKSSKRTANPALPVDLDAVEQRVADAKSASWYPVPLDYH